MDENYSGTMGIMPLPIYPSLLTEEQQRAALHAVEVWQQDLIRIRQET